MLAESAGGRIWPRHVDQAVRKQEAGGASVVFLAMTQKVGDALLEYQTQTSPEPRPAQAPAVVRAPAPAAAAVAPAVAAEPGFAPPVADINARTMPAPDTNSYPDASRAIGNYINAIWARIVASVLLVVVAIGMGASGNLAGLANISIIEGIVMVVLTGWQVWALFSYASHSPPHTDTKGSATTAAILTAVGGLIAIIGAFTTEVSLRRSPGQSGLTLLAGLISLVATLLVVSICRRIAQAFGDGRLEVRGRNVNTFIGLSIGGVVLFFLMGIAGAGMFAVLILLATVGVLIAAVVFYIIMLYGAKRCLAYGRS